MIFRQSIRVRLTVWYTALTLVAMAVTGALAWLLVRHSVRVAADERLAAHAVGLKRFADGLERDLTLEQLRDEYREYADVTLGTTLLQVRDANGDLLAVPDLPDWSAGMAAIDSGGQPRDVTLGGEPYRVAAFTTSTIAGPLRGVAAVPLGSAYLALRRARALMLWLLPLVCALAAAGTYLVSGRALRPLDRLASAAQAIDVGSLSRRLEVPASKGELQRLAVTFNGMLDRLESGVANIARFTSEASHELRTPVSVVRTTAELALRRERSPEDYRLALSEILAESERMSDLVDDLLTMARSDAGVEAASRSAVDLASAASAFVESWRPSLGGRAADLVFAAPAQGAIVTAEPREIRRLLSILCENSLKYTPAGGRIVVSVARDANMARLVVEDTGIGVSADDRPRVFERFFRGAAARAGDAPGSGLGLAIADVIVRRLGGSIALDSPIHPAGAAGTRMTVSFPLMNDAR